ncbi:MAG: hypothetical protein E6J78_00165 [Deltaproteobacteria bacterium]|nr:MAG: hypothetical protein E6J78_00165 [Deltaproteobacteria bacterium]
MSFIVFLGPSLPKEEALALAPCVILPPARQGDIWRALEQRPETIALIDGVFEAQPSVWHHEILDALDAGVAVFGGSSMGALRAAELQERGMVGVGQIFRWYRDGTIVDDAEVALLHAGAEHGFRPLTVPQVNVRWAAREAAKARVLRSAEAQELVGRSARIFYQERTWPRVLASLSPRARQRWERWQVPDLKADDARKTLRAAAQSKVALPVRPRQPAPSSLVRRRKLREAEVRSLWSRPDARDLADAGLRRALIAGFARELGLAPDEGEVRAAELLWLRRLGLRDRAALCARSGMTEAEVARMAEELALERLMLDHAQRVLSDGPSADEAIVAEARLRPK